MDPRFRQRYEHRLGRLQTTVRRRLAVHGLAATVGAGGLVLLTVLATLGATTPPAVVRAGLALSGLALTALVAWAALWRPLRRVWARDALARALDRRTGRDDVLAAAEEALRRPDRWRTDTPVRAALVGRLLGRAARLAQDLDLPRAVPVARPATVFAALVVVLLAGSWLQRSAPEVLERGGRALVRTASVAPQDPRPGLRPMPGPDHVIAGGGLAVAAWDLVGTDDVVVCEVRAGSGLWRPLPAREVPDPAASPLLGSPFRIWEATLADVREDLVYRFRAGARISAERTLTVWRPPLLAELAATVVPPAYTGLPPQDLPRLPAFFEAPQGSRLELRGRASRPLQRAAVVTAAADTVPLAVRADTLAGSLVLDQPRRFRLELVDDRALRGQSELLYEAAVIADRAPRAVLQRPEDDGNLPLSAPLLLRASAADDHGLTAFGLLIRRGDPQGGAWIADLPGQPDADPEEAGWERIPLPATPATAAPGDTSGAPGIARRDARTGLGRLPLVITPRPVPDAGEVRLDLELRAGDLAVVPGDVVELMLEARDNRQPPPAGVGRSAVLRLEVPSSLDLLRARDENEAHRRGDLADVRRRTESLGQDLERLRRELLKDPTVDFERGQELQAAVERQQELQQELARVAESLQQDLETLAENNLTSPELAEKMDQIAELLAEARDQGLQDLLARLREQLGQMSSKDLQRAMEDLGRNQDQMLRRLDTAMSMLRDLAREQEMEGLTDLVAEMLRKQQDLADATRQEAATDAESEPAADAEGEPQDGEAGAPDREHAEGEPQDGQESGDQQGEPQDGESGEQDGEPQDGGSDQSGEPDGEPQEGDQGRQGEQGEPTDPAEDQAAQEELARRQEALSEEMAALEQRLQEALEQLQEQAESGEMSAAEEQMRQALEDALEQLEQQQTEQTMQQAGESLQQQQQQDAAQQMDQALTDLAGLYHVMLRSQMAMQMAMQQQQAGQMRDLAADLLALSDRQEALGLDVPATLRDLRVEDLLRRQYEVVQGTATVRDALGDVAGAAPREVLRMLDDLDALLTTLGRAVDQLEERRGNAARQASDTALADMNRLVIGLLTQAQMTGQGGGQGSQQPMLSQQLRQMSQEQSGLNALAEQLRQRQGRLSQELRAQMQRLQQGQQGLAGQARELAEEQRQRAERGDGQRLLGDLDQLARDMESVGDDLAGGLITPETLRRQDRILSRLLDMQNAARERDWARRRESRSAIEVYADQEGAGDPVDQVDPEARRWRPVEEAPPAYRDLVRQYFREVQRLHEGAGRDARGQRDTGGMP